MPSKNPLQGGRAIAFSCTAWPQVRNFALVYVEMAAARATPEQRASAVRTYATTANTNKNKKGVPICGRM